jgi:hypothetical protein
MMTILETNREFLAPQDGAEKQDREERRSKEVAGGPRRTLYARLNPIYLVDDLFSRQPLCEDVLAANGHFIFVCKPYSHPLIQEYVTGVGLQTHEETVKRGKSKSS